MPFTDALGDARYAWRKLRRAPLFTLVAVGTLAVGMAASTTVFSFVNAAWLRPLPYPDADRIAAVSESDNYRWLYSELRPASVEQLLRPTTSFERMAVHRDGDARFADGTTERALRTLAVDTSFAAMFRLRMQLGRFLSHDEILGDAPVAAISDTLWRTRFGADSSIIGRTIVFTDARYAVIGVMPRGFRYPYQADVWVPLPRQVLQSGDGDEPVYMIAKLRPNVSREAAQAELDVISARIREAAPAGNERLRLRLREEMLDRNAQAFMPMPSMFLGAAFLLLLVACTNVGNLFLARAAERRAEMAVRGSLGASRLRLARQLLTEALVVATIASVVGTLLSVWLVKVSLSLIPTTGFPSWIQFGLDVRVLAVAIATAFVITLVVGLAPAREGTRFDLARALKSGGDTGAGRKGVHRAGRRGLVVQLALALVLVVAVGLLVRSYRAIQQVDLGYPAEQVASVHMSFDPARYPDAESQMRFVEELLPRLAQLPGARIVTARGGYVGPRDEPPTPRNVTPAQRVDVRLRVDGDTIPGRASWFGTRHVVGDGYFDAVGVRLLRGRLLTPEDALGTAPVVVVSRRFAELALDGAEPLGRTVQIGADGLRYTIVGIVEDVRMLRGGGRGYSLEREANLYFPARQARGLNYEILARAHDRQGAEALHQAIAGIVRSEDPTLAIYNDRTLAGTIDMHLFTTRVFGWMLGALAATALFLAVIGVYGLVAYGVAQRTREIGVRLALGGTTPAIVRMIVGDGLRFVAIGLAVGLVLAAGATRLLSIILYGVSPMDLATYAGAAALFGVVALVACWLPARHAARVDPIVALRSE